MSTTASLAATLEALAASSDGTVAYSIVPLDGGEPIRRNADQQQPTASCMKVYLIAALYAAAARGELSLDERRPLRREDRTLGSGVLKLLAPGLEPTLRDHARLMIAISDNISTNVIIDRLGGAGTVDEAVHALPIELRATAIRDRIRFDTIEPFFLSCPDDFTSLLAAIHGRRCTGSPELDDEIYWTLRRQQHRSMIPRHLPCSDYAEEFGVDQPVRCGNKTGSMPGFRGDVGIVETTRCRWVLAFQVQGPPDFNTGDTHPYNLLIAEMSRLVFDVWGLPDRA